jgi:hypothetical protein
MNSIRTKPRLSSALLFCSIIVGVCFLIFIITRSLLDDDGYDSRGALAAKIALFVSIGIFVVFVVCLFRLKFIKVEFSNQLIKVFYPFQIRTQTVPFNGLAGFYITSRTSRYLIHKVIVFRTVAGKEYSISDFEISNLNQVQKAIWPCFNLLDLKTKEVLSDEQKKEYLAGADRIFNLEQAGVIRFGSWMMLIISTLAAIVGTGLFIPLNRDIPVLFWVFIILSSGFSISKLILARRMSIRQLDGTPDSGQHRLLR